MYFTETPHLQSIEAMMKTIPHLPQAETTAEQGARKMKLRFSSKAHYDRFMGFFKSRRTNPLCCEPEFCAAIYLMTADPELWNKVKSAVTDENINFRRIKLGVVAADNYALYKTAKDIFYNKQGLNGQCSLTMKARLILFWWHTESQMTALDILKMINSVSLIRHREKPFLYLSKTERRCKNAKLCNKPRGHDR